MAIVLGNGKAVRMRMDDPLKMTMRPSCLEHLFAVIRHCVAVRGYVVEVEDNEPYEGQPNEGLVLHDDARDDTKSCRLCSVVDQVAIPSNELRNRPVSRDKGKKVREWQAFHPWTNDNGHRVAAHVHFPSVYLDRVSRSRRCGNS